MKMCKNSFSNLTITYIRIICKNFGNLIWVLKINIDKLFRTISVLMLIFFI